MLSPDRNGFKRKLGKKEIEKSTLAGREIEIKRRSLCLLFNVFNTEELTAHLFVERNDLVKNNTKCNFKREERIVKAISLSRYTEKS